MDEKNGIEVPRKNEEADEAADDEPFSQDSQPAESGQEEVEMPISEGELAEEIPEQPGPLDESSDQPDMSSEQDQPDGEESSDLPGEEHAGSAPADVGDNRQTLVSSGESPGATIKQADFQQLSSTSGRQEPQNIELLMDVELPVSIELGQTRMRINDLLTLGPGSIVELDKLVGEPVDLLVNRKRIARGEVVVVEENFGLRITQLVSPEERLKNLQ